MPYDGELKTNLVFASLFNMIISLQVFDTGISDLDGIYQSRKVDGTLFGDTKLYISISRLYRRIIRCRFRYYVLSSRQRLY